MMNSIYNSLWAIYGKRSVFKLNFSQESCQVISNKIFSMIKIYEAFEKNKITKSKKEKNSEIEPLSSIHQYYKTSIYSSCSKFFGLTFIPRHAILSTKLEESSSTGNYLYSAQAFMNTGRQFINITPKVTLIPSAEKMIPLASKRIAPKSTLIVNQHKKNSSSSKFVKKKIDYVTVITFENYNGDTGMLFCDLGSEEGKTRKDLRLICFENVNDTKRLIVELTKRYKQEIRLVTPTILRLCEAEVIAFNAGLNIFILRDKEIELEADWTFDEFIHCIFQIHEIRKWAQKPIF